MADTITVLTPFTLANDGSTHAFQPGEYAVIPGENAMSVLHHTVTRDLAQHPITQANVQANVQPAAPVVVEPIETEPAEPTEETVAQPSDTLAAEAEQPAERPDHAE